MTAVEFYDRTPIENVISSLTTEPDKIIFLGDDKGMKGFEGTYNTFLKNRKFKTKVEYRNINKNSINNIVAELSSIVEAEGSCVFDLTGGDDLALVAMGIVYEKYAKKGVLMQRFNMNNGVVYDCDNDGKVFYKGTPLITVEENVMLHGGLVRKDQDGKRTIQWELNEDFICDVDKMWSICRVNPGLWNARVNVLEAILGCNKTEDALRVSASLSDVRQHLTQEKIRYVSVQGFLKILNKNGLICDYTEKDDTVYFEFKNQQVKRCLEKAGTVLELKVLTAAKRVTDKEGNPVYTDMMSGVYIDWDGDFHHLSDEEKDTENEIDVVLMKGLVPIFISCKNGHIEDEELYKLETVTNRFGGAYAKKVLIASYVGKSVNSVKYFKQRAKDMKINLIDGVHNLSDAQFIKMIKHLIYS